MLPRLLQILSYSQNEHWSLLINACATKLHEMVLVLASLNLKLLNSPQQLIQQLVHDPATNHR